MKDERRVTYSDNHAFILNPSSFIPRLSFRPGREVWSGRRDLNSRPSPWQGDALPLSYSRFKSTTDSNDSMIVVKRATLKGMSWFELVSVQPQWSSCLGGKQNAIQDLPPSKTQRTL